MTMPRDRAPHILEIDPASPNPPLNALCSSGFDKGTIDLRWTPPTELVSNTKFDILGVNVYRSFNSAYGPWTRLNAMPIGSGFYRDRTQITLALQEDVSAKFFARGSLDVDARYAFQVEHRPLYVEAAPWSDDHTNINVSVTVNGELAFVESINAPTGEIELRKTPSFDPVNQKFTPAVLPRDSNDVVLATYKYIANEVKTALGQRIFYLLTTVGRTLDSGELVETPLTRATALNNREIEKLDWIWREAIRRNRFILDQGGERVKVFIRKTVGPRCGCYSESNKQPSSTCEVCYGTGILGGYDGPYEITMAPPDGAASIVQGNRGRTMEHPYDTWTGPVPLLSQRDFFVKMNGDRYGIGPVSMPSNRGMQLQQFFTVAHLDESSIQYKVPVMDTTYLVAPQTRYPSLGPSTPMLTEREAIPDEREFRGSTVAFENAHRR